VKAKWHIQQNLTENDYLVFNANQSDLSELAATSKATLVPFSTLRKVDGAYTDNDAIYFKGEKVMECREVGVPGKHNLENALVAVAVGKLKGKANEEIRVALMSFKGVRHRTQYVTEINGRKFYNDSKATNILATEMALSGFNNENLILLAGGLDRGNGFDELVDSLKGSKALILFGETAKKLEDAGKKAGVENIIFTENVETAVPIAYANSSEGDVILLSPANASWDQYKNFEIRGDKFMDAVKKLEEEETK
jgi:UDP-N-acetylmuramoylalanine--D-glutamate ligase